MNNRSLFLFILFSPFLLILFNNCGQYESSTSSLSSQIQNNSDTNKPTENNTTTSTNNENNEIENVTEPDVTPQPPTEEPDQPINPSNKLFAIEALKYQGAFRLSSNDIGESSVNYATGTLAYNPDHKSIYIAGHNHHNAIAEFTVPELSKATDVKQLPEVAEARQGFKKILSQGTPSGANDKITGLYYKDNTLIINSEVWYDADGKNDLTTLVMTNANDFSQSNITGYYKLEGKAHAAGYISEVPENHRAQIGNDHITGWSKNYSINSRYSIGPSLFSVNIDSLLKGTQSINQNIATKAFMNFPFSEGKYLSEASIGNSDNTANALFNQLSRAMYAFIIPGTNTYFVIGSSGGIDSGIGYKIKQDGTYECPGFCSYKSADNYNYYWLFDMNDIYNASSVSSIKPYAFGKLNIPFDKNGQHQVLGASYDASSDQLFISLENAGQVGDFDRPPLIVVYSLLGE